MPESTEQILHPEKYTADEAPIAVDAAGRPGDPARVGLDRPDPGHVRRAPARDLAREAGVAAGRATTAAAGWGGDRLAVIEGPDGAWAVAMQTVWDTDADAAEFETAATTALKKATGDAQVLPGAGGTTRWVLIASDATTLGKVAGRARARRLRLAYIESGAEIPSRPSALASVIRAALGQREPRRGALRLVGVHDPGVAVEGVERRRQLGRVGGDAVRLLGRDGVLDDLRDSGRSRAPAPPRAHPTSAPSTPVAGASPSSSALRRIEAIRACAYWT